MVKRLLNLSLISVALWFMVIIIFIINISIIIAIFVSGPGYDLLICVISAGFRQEQ